MRRATGPRNINDPRATVDVQMLRDINALTPVPTSDYQHEQLLPATQWVIEHGLRYDPGGIVVFDSDGDTLEGWSVAYDEPGQVLRVLFDIPVTGSAFLS